MSNPNPSPSTRFGAPGGNVPGRTSAQIKASIEAAEIAAKLQKRMLESLAGLFNERPEKEHIVEHVRADTLRLLKDAMDRGFGLPVQTVDNTSSDGTMSPGRIEIVAVMPDGTDSED